MADTTATRRPRVSQNVIYGTFSVPRGYAALPWPGSSLIRLRSAGHEARVPNKGSADCAAKRIQTFRMSGSTALIGTADFVEVPSFDVRDVVFAVAGLGGDESEAAVAEVVRFMEEGPNPVDVVVALFNDGDFARANQLMLEHDLDYMQDISPHLS